MKIAVGCDHAGYEMKLILTEWLEKQGYEIMNYGTDSAESMDYPDVVHPLALAVENGEFEQGVLVCGSGQGASMTANKYSNVRAALCWDLNQAKLTRQHNNANIISLPGRFLDFEVAKEMIITFLNEKFEDGRHINRINKIPVSL